MPRAAARVAEPLSAFLADTWWFGLTARCSASQFADAARLRAARGFVNLEPWYEGIKDRFWLADQLFAYWVSMLSGARTHCYGAQGMWNAGDGTFLSHWGRRTLADALARDTPRLLATSHRLLLASGVLAEERKTQVDADGERLRSITLQSSGVTLQFFPDVAEVAAPLPQGRLWLPLEGRDATGAPARGPLVVIRSTRGLPTEGAL